MIENAPEMTLPEVIQHERRKNEAEPSRPQRPSAEMPHIGVEGLGACHRQKNGSQHQETAPGRIPQHCDAIDRVDGEEYARLLRDSPDAEQRQHQEPDQHHRAEEAAYRGRTVALHQEEAGEESERDRDDIGVEERRRHFQSLDRAQHRDRRGDDAVAVEQRGADQTRRHDPSIPLAPLTGRAQDQCGERQEPALAMIVGAHDDKHVFDRDDQRQGPDDQRKSTEDCGLAQIAEIDERLAHGIERRGADIAIDDAERGDGQARADLRPTIAAPCCRVHRQGLSGSARRTHDDYREVPEAPCDIWLARCRSTTLAADPVSAFLAEFLGAGAEKNRQSARCSGGSWRR